jgi:hypothetical protein
MCAVVSLFVCNLLKMADTSLLVAVTLLTLINTGVDLALANEPKEYCHLPGDLVFVLDESGSIWGPAFQEQLQFVELVADTFDIQPTKTRIGLMTFASDVKVFFHLDTYDNSNDVKQAIRKITQRRGGTRTDLALSTMRREMFAARHSRSNAAHVAIVVTDGESEEPSLTLEEARLVHDAGIIVIAIGVGPRITLDELKAIASSDDLVFTAPSYAALEPLRDQLAWKACEVLTSTTTTTTTTTTTPEPPAPMIAGCSSRAPVDVIFSLPNEADSQQTDSCLRLVSALADDLDIGPAAVQLGVTPRLCSDEKAAIRLKDHDTVDGLRSALQERHLADTTDIDRQLEYLRTGGFSAGGGGRDQSAKLAVLVVDRPPTDTNAARRELRRLRQQVPRLRTVVVGVGSLVARDELELLGTVLAHVDSYQQLDDIELALIQHICTVIQDVETSNNERQLRTLHDTYDRPITSWWRRR